MSNLKKLTESLDVEGCFDSSTYLQNIYSPYNLSPRDYLKFADEDLRSIDSIHSRINAMSNIKRAIDCRVDSILLFWGLRKKADRHLNFTKKAELLNKMGVITPRLIEKINTYRNSIEHVYEVPTVDRINDYRDTAELFLGYTDKYLKIDPSDEFNTIASHQCECETPDEKCRFGDGIAYLNIKVDREKKKIYASFTYDSEDSSLSEKFIIPSTDHENYMYIINLWHKAQDR